MSLSVRASTLGLILWFVLQPPLSTAVLTVESGCTLVDAISAANADAPVGECPAGSGADEIRMTDSVFLSEIDNAVYGSTALPTIVSEIAVEGGGHGIVRSRALSIMRHFAVAKNGTLTLRDLELVNGVAPSFFYFQAGGAVLNYGDLNLADVDFIANGDGSGYGGAVSNAGNMTVIGSTFLSNEGSIGGAIDNRGTALLVNTTLTGNIGNYGAALRNAGSARVVGSRVLGNTVDNQGDGGAFFNAESGVLQIESSEIDSNSGLDGAGIYNLRDLILSRTGVTDNRAREGSGGLFSDTDLAEISIQESVFAGNVAVGGLSAIDLRGDSDVEITNTTVAENVVRPNGFAIFAGVASMELNHVTVAANLEETGGPAAQINVDFSSGEIGIANSLVGGGAPNCTGDLDFLIDRGGNFDDDGSCGSFGLLTGLDSMLANNGGPTETLALSLGSSAIDAGLDCGTEKLDQRGFPRLDTACDSGAFEFGASPVSLSVGGNCPGLVTVDVSGGSPNGVAALYAASRPGLFEISAGPCIGLELLLGEPIRVATVNLDTVGSGSVEFDVPDLACGALLRAVDGVSCGLSEIVTGP